MKTFAEIDYDILPEGYAPLEREPEFNPDKHLQLEEPTQIVSLKAFGYSDDELKNCPSDFGVTNIFRILSDEGATALYDVCKQLEAFTTSNPRIQRNTRGAVYRSKFLRDLCLSPEITSFLSRICGLELLPHTIPHQLGHLNYAPIEVGENVDKWHVDTLRYDYVMFVTDPKKNDGGAFQYFEGTKAEIAALKDAGKPLPQEKIISPDMPGPGYAIMQQGNMVVHQAKGLNTKGERITMVNGYIPRDPNFPDYTRYDQLVFADPAHVVTTEYSRHIALHGQRLLEESIVGEGFSEDRAAYVDRLRAAAEMLNKAADQINESDDAVMEHFGD